MNYESLRSHCEHHSDISRKVIDDYLMYYAAEREKLVPVMDVQLKKYRHIVRKIEPSYINFLKAEFIVHRIFRKNGYIHNYLSKHVVQSLPEDQRRLLEHNAAHPWRYSFAMIMDKPAKDFFYMEDIITGEEYLLFSPGMQLTEDEHHPRIWLNMIGYNGQCWQTYGLMIPLKSFDIDDIYFFGTELDPDIEDHEMLQNHLENNPWPYFMLLNFSLSPVITARGHEVRQLVSFDPIENFSTDAVSDKFKVEWDGGIYKISPLNNDDEFPHFAQAFYNEANQELTRTASTEQGFNNLTEALKYAGYDLSPVADISVSTSMLHATKQILNKDIQLHPYEDLFDESTPESDKSLEAINQFMQLALPYINSGERPDIKALAEQSGIKYETAKEIFENGVKQIEELKRKFD